MGKMQQSGADRREFFRINDTLVVEYSVVNQDRMNEVVNNIERADDHIDHQDRHQLRSLQNNLNHLLDNINQSNRDIARALRLLDDKINLLVQKMNRQNKPVKPEQLTHANLSGGGIAFMVSEPVKNRESVELYLQLLPSSTEINALARVVSCDKVKTADPEHPYHLRLAFTHMDDQDRNLLVKHTLNRQAEALRSGQKDLAMSLREI